MAGETDRLPGRYRIRSSRSCGNACQLLSRRSTLELAAPEATATRGSPSIVRQFRVVGATDSLSRRDRGSLRLHHGIDRQVGIGMQCLSLSRDCIATRENNGLQCKPTKHVRPDWTIGLVRIGYCLGADCVLA